MIKKEFKDLTNEELIKEKRKLQHNKIFNATFIGALFGVFVYSAINNGFGFFTFLPLALIYVFIRNGKNVKELERELKSRNL